MKTPILFIIFNRISTTEKAFTAIKQYKPTKLFVAADGPRIYKSGEKETCEKVRDLVAKIDWPCTVKRLYRKKNLGCKKAVSSAIDWFFNNVEEGIILEDDCLPNPSFFKFCEHLLEKCRDDKRIMHIGGNNFQSTPDKFDNGYYFSKYPHIWGWATWRRAWKYFDVKMDNWPKIKKTRILDKYWSTYWEKSYWKAIFDLTYLGKFDAWGYQWLYAIRLNGGISITPGVNLVRNIGFGQNSTHFSDSDARYDVRPEKMRFPLTQPKEIVANIKFDKHTFVNNYMHDPLTVIALRIRSFKERFL